MQRYSLITALCVIANIASGCSSKPRQFIATVNPPAADEAGYQRDFATCDMLARKGYKSGFKAAALSAVSGAAGGVGGSVAIGSAAVAVGNAGFTGSLAAASVAFPIVGIAAGFGVSRAIRGGREKRLKQAITNCLGEYGYSVSEWTRVKKPKKSQSAQTSS
jgi:hypothetical protein